MKKVNLFLCAAILIVMSTLTAFIGIEEKSVKRTMIKEVKIGNQIWMVENLNVDKFKNGNPIPQARTNEEWKKAAENKQPAWCYYDNDPANGTKYGKLYNWFAVNDPRGLAPAGYHIPTDAEWTKLTDYLSGEKEAGEKMKSTSGWKNNGNGTNESRFSGLPGGFRGNDAAFSYLGFGGQWWSSTENSTATACSHSLLFYYSGVLRIKDDKKIFGYSIRCLRD